MNPRITLPIFGEVTPEETDWEYRHCAQLWKHPLGGTELDIDVNFKTLDAEAVRQAARALADIERLDGIGLAAIAADFRAGGEAASYLREWAEEIFPQIFSEEELRDYLAGTDENAPLVERLLARLRRVRFGVYVGAEEHFITMDYAFGYELERGFRDDMLVVKLDERYEVTEIASEG